MYRSRPTSSFAALRSTMAPASLPSCDLAIKDDRIIAVGKFQVVGNPRVLDATGLVITPGFIDLHTIVTFP